MKNVRFKVEKIVDIRKQGSEIEIGAILTGEYCASNGAIYFTDKAKCDWVFYKNVTAKIVANKN